MGQRQEKTQTETSAGTEENYRLGEWERQTNSSEIGMFAGRLARNRRRNGGAKSARSARCGKFAGEARVSFENDNVMTFF